jgi:DNA-binding NtrC family response regulator
MFQGVSAAAQAVCGTIATTASSKAAVFITGESGTGKEVCAEAIHRASDRADRPFVAINCAAIPKDLAESELFGHVKGAFTGAVSNRAGAAARAHRGTLFFDEICEMGLELQAKLLRFLQTGMVQRVGAGEAEPVDVRIICATNRDPRAEMAAGRFREDLYYRLHVIPIHLPPLRERQGDALEIARGLLLDYAREEGKGFVRLAPCAEAAIAGYGWPGNVRELQNALRNAVVLHAGEELAAAMLPEAVRAATAQPDAPQPAPSVPVVSTATSVEPAAWGTIAPLWMVERDMIEAAIRHCDNNIARAAAALGVSASTLYRKRQAWAGIGPT